MECGVGTNLTFCSTVTRFFPGQYTRSQWACMLSTSKPTHRAWVARASPGTKRGGLLPKHTAFLVRGDVSENLCGACAFFTTRRNGSTLPLPTKSSLAASRPDAARHARIQRTGSRATRRVSTTPVCCGASAVVRHRSVPHSQRNSVNSGLVNSPPRSDPRPQALDTKTAPSLSPGGEYLIGT